jgi:CheY-like chemotaxis protein
VLADPIQIEQVLFNLCINARDAIVDFGSIRLDFASARTPAPARRAARPCAALGRRSPSPTPAAASTKRFARECSSRSSRPSRSAEAPEWAWRWCTASSTTTAATCSSTRAMAKAPSFASCFPSPTAATSRRAARSRPRRAPARLAGTVLLVEDEAMVGAFMAELLGGWGLDVVRASDGIDAERRLADGETRIDVVLTDQTMPGMTGLALAARSRELRPDVPVLLYTGFGEGLDEADVARSGVRAVLRKPVDRVVLHAALSRALAPADA